uniref:Replication protein A 70 kDa DNA-binding subunit n=1 Tax=Lingulaulax polyedra TaxID=160621 RepID=A0A516AFV1_LINPO|nr:replication protein A 70 kDa DNA-binding subunit [Lingulodinium polyedra]
MAPTGQCCLPISELSAYVQRWTIRARVTSKSVLRTFSKGAGNGKVFHVHLLDVHGGEIRASFFNEAADKLFETLQVGKCYSLSRGSVRIANRQFNPCNHRYEISFDKMAEVEQVADDGAIDAVKLNLTDIRSLQSRTLPCNVDLCGIVTASGPVVAFTSREGKELVKREITIADDTATSIGVTLWGERAKQEGSTLEGHPVACLKGVVVKEWNGGRSGSLSESGALVTSPTAAEAQRVRQWWAQGGSSQALTPLSAAGGGGSARAANAKCLDLAEVRTASERVLQQPELYSVVCRLALVQFAKKGETQPLYYDACQELRDGKPMPCNRRVDGSGFCPSCNRAGKTAPRLTLRCRFADCGDVAWLTTFHEAAQQAIGMTAEQARAMEQTEGGREALEAAIMGQYFGRPLQLTLRAKLDSYNGEARTNVSCIDARPVPRGERGRAMLREVREMLAAGSD